MRTYTRLAILSELAYGEQYSLPVRLVRQYGLAHRTVRDELTRLTAEGWAVNTGLRRHQLDRRFGDEATGGFDQWRHCVNPLTTASAPTAICRLPRIDDLKYPARPPVWLLLFDLLGRANDDVSDHSYAQQRLLTKFVHHRLAIRTDGGGRERITRCHLSPEGLALAQDGVVAFKWLIAHWDGRPT